MMLKISGTFHCKKVSVDVDKYVPFTVEFVSNDPSPSLYWRGGDGMTSLIEIGLSRKTGVIRSITLTSINSENVSRVNDSVSGADLPEIEGLPAFDLSGWSMQSTDDFFNNFFDEIPSRIRLLIGDNYVVLIFGKAETAERFIANGNIRFGIAENGELSTINVFGLTQQQLSIIEIAIRTMV